MTGLIHIFAVLAKARDGAINDARIDRGNRIIIDAQALHDTGPEGFDNHVGFCGELEE